MSLDFVFDFGTHNKCVQIHINCILILFISCFNILRCIWLNPLQANVAICDVAMSLLLLLKSAKCDGMMIETSPHENWCRHFDKLGRRKVIIFGPLQRLSIWAYIYVFYAVWVFSSHT